jgi:hypothetical protein
MWGSAASPTAMTSTRLETQWCSTSTLRRVLEGRKFTCSGEYKCVDIAGGLYCTQDGDE